MSSSVSSIIDQFGGPEGRRRLVESLRQQKIVENSEELATKLADVASIARHEPAVPFIVQENEDNDVFFILAGTVSIQINGREHCDSPPLKCQMELRQQPVSTFTRSSYVCR